MVPQGVSGGASILVLTEGVFIDNTAIEILEQPRCNEGLWKWEWRTYRQ